MFGYINPHDPYLYKKDDVLYRSLYCGVCKSIGATCGQLARFTLTYDIAFLSAFAHNIIGCDVEIKKSHCVVHPFKKRPMIKRDDLSDRLAAVNVILAKYKLSDDRFDEGKGTIKSSFINPAYKKAKKLMPSVDSVVRERYSELRTLESADNGLIDEVSGKFGDMLAELSDCVFDAYKTADTHKLFYYVGKWIYIIDALDDYDKDVKKKSYNVFYARYGESDFKSLIARYADDIDFMFADIFKNIGDSYDNIKFFFNRDLIENILFRGLKMKTKQVIGSHADDLKSESKRNKRG